MKIRTNYVSNSSSSSFCILGIKLDSEKNKSDKINLYLKDNKFLFFRDVLNDLNIYSDVNLDMVDGISDYYGERIIGAHPTTIKDDQTLLQFKQQIVKDLKTIGYENVEITDLEWYSDGGLV